MSGMWCSCLSPGTPRNAPISTILIIPKKCAAHIDYLYSVQPIRMYSFR